MPAKKTPNFEKSLAELETLVHTLEDGDLSLEDALKTFEKGVKLSHSCQQALEQAEQKVQVLLAKDGELTAKEYSTDEGGQI